MQLELHLTENNPFSQGQLESRREHLTNNCQRVLELLKSGHHLNTKEVLIQYDISSLPRRILDLKNSGIKIEKYFDDKGNYRYKLVL
jgi:hypothetical protein